MMKGAWTPPTMTSATKRPRQRLLRCKTTLQTFFLNPDPFQQWYGIKNIAKVRINGGSCMALLDNGAQINTVMPRYVSNHSLQIGPGTNLMGSMGLHGAG